MERPFSIENLENFYAERLGTISSKKDLEATLAQGEINLELNLDDFVLPKRREEILRNNPGSIDILGILCHVNYGYNGWDKKFTASVKIPASNVLKLIEAPILPSGRALLLEVISKEGETYSQFSGTDLQELKQKSKQFLIKKQWDEWRYSDKKPLEQKIENFDLLKELPVLPEPIPFGDDPETQEPLLSYPAINVESYYSGENRFSIKYFSSQEEARNVQVKVLELAIKAKEEKIKKEEKERLLAPTNELLAKVKDNFKIIENDYHNYGLSYSSASNIENKIHDAERKIETDTAMILEILQNLDQKLAEALLYKIKKEESKEIADKAIAEHYSICPLCEKELQDGICANSTHNAELIDFEMDGEYETGPAILSQLVTEQGKIIAQLYCSAGTGRKYYKGDVYLETGSDIDNDNIWQGEPFESVKFEDLKRILTLDQMEERRKRLEEQRLQRERKEIFKKYEEDLEYAKQQVEQEYWKQGKFIKGTHPKSGEEQWELTLKNKGLVIKYVVDRWSRQPSAEDIKYFYSESKTIVNTQSFQLILVRLEDPFPEDKPEEQLVEEIKPEKNLKESSPEALQQSLEELKEKWKTR